MKSAASMNATSVSATSISSCSSSSGTISQQQLTLEQLIDVRDTLKGPPLTNRSVFIPFTSKAFVPGRLLPHTTQCNDNDDPNTVHISTQSTMTLDADIAKEHEYVRLRTTAASGRGNDSSFDTTAVNDIGVMMTRQQALDCLQREIDDLKQKKKIVPKQQTPKITTTQSLNLTTNAVLSSSTMIPSNSSTSHSRQKIIPSDEESTKPTITSTTSSNSLPFIEIREELDDTGNILTGQAVNVTNHLNYLSQQQQQQQQQQNSCISTHTALPPNNNNNNPILNNNPLMTTTTESTNNSAAAAHIQVVDTDTDHVHQQKNETMSDLAPENLKPIISDTEYDAITRRLNELMILEEQHEERNSNDTTGIVQEIQRSTKKNAPRTKSPQTKTMGWAKGFLNTPPQKNTVTKQSREPSTTTTTANKIPSKSMHQNNHDASSVKLQLSSNENTDNNKKVSFTENDTVQVIPRIGQRSIKELQQPQQQQFSYPREHSTASASSVVSSFDTNAVTSHVIEKQQRTHRSRRIATAAAVTTTSDVVGTGDDRNNAVDDDRINGTIFPTKKLSRFAQERQQLQR